MKVQFSYRYDLHEKLTEETLNVFYKFLMATQYK